MNHVLPRDVSDMAAQTAAVSRHRPRNCVWELTLKCNLNCVHCGSSAGRARTDELSTAECLDVVDQLHELGCELITLSGGEPLIRPDWYEIARAISDAGMFVNMVTNGLLIDDATAVRMKDAGLCNVGVSIDGPLDVHDRIRAPGSFLKSMEGIRTLVRNGMSVGVMTTINRWNMSRLAEIRQIAIDAGASMWRLQLAKPMGEICGDNDFIVAPRHLLSIIPELAEMKKKGGIHLAVGDSIGYYGPHDRTLRGRGWRGREESWQGCRAGMDAIGIEADGGIKGCLSIQAKAPDGSDPYREGSVREQSLAELWFRPGAFAYNREFTCDDLKGVCRTCSKSRVCRGGARCVSTAVAGVIGEDPYCWTRVAAMNQNHTFRDYAARTAAAAGLALVFGSGCFESEDQADIVGEVTTLDAIEQDCPAVDVGQREVFADVGLSDVGQVDNGAVTDQGGVDAGIDCETVCCMCDYGIIPDDVWQKCCAPDPVEPVPDVVEPVEDVAGPDAGIDCEKVCCDCEYGVIPDEVYQECCVAHPADPAPDAVTPEDAVTTEVVDCSSVCCMCDYGIIPDDVYQECCVEACKDVCCNCDYGEPPPPQCCP